MDVVNAEQVRIVEEVGACAVMALECVLAVPKAALPHVRSTIDQRNQTGRHYSCNGQSPYQSFRRSPNPRSNWN